MKTADLHLHTPQSDGTDTVAERVADANERDISCLAVTDHDVMPTMLDDRVQVIDGVEVIAGAEFKTRVDGRNIEILAYFIDPTSDALHDLASRIQERRKERMETMIGSINDAEGTDITLDEVGAHAERTIGRPHLAAVLVDRGLVDSVGEAFAEYIGDDCPHYVATDTVPAAEVIERVQADGGVVSLAHPGRSLPEDAADDAVAELVDAGLDAIEVFYTYDKLQESGRDVHFTAKRSQELADQFDLVETGGSDCHGSESDKYYLGSVSVPYRCVERLKEIRQSR